MKTMEKLSLKYKAILDIHFAKIDASENEWDSRRFPVESFPTLYVAMKHQKEVPLRYKGDRTIEDLEVFMMRNDILFNVLDL